MLRGNKYMKVIDTIMRVIEAIMLILTIMAICMLFAKNIYPSITEKKPIKESNSANYQKQYEVKEVYSPEFELMARTVYAEAGNQGYEGKRLVAAVILNRVDDESFPDTITEVLEAPKQFSVVGSGVINNYEIDKESVRACKDEMKERTNTDIVYFNPVGFINGKAWKKVGDHYFSTK